MAGAENPTPRASAADEKQACEQIITNAANRQATSGTLGVYSTGRPDIGHYLAHVDTWEEAPPDPSEFVGRLVAESISPAAPRALDADNLYSRVVENVTGRQMRNV